MSNVTGHVHWVSVNLLEYYQCLNLGACMATLEVFHQYLLCRCLENINQFIDYDFYLWVLHPVAHLSNWFLMMRLMAS
jgi:hypothetical protein